MASRLCRGQRRSVEGAEAKKPDDDKTTYQDLARDSDIFEVTHFNSSRMICRK
jgi:hypothetical protein